MPYKHIAAHLKKTELACRLHYHQLSHGTNRRKRAASISSCSSGRSPLTPDQRMSPDVEVAASLATPELSPVEPQSSQLWNIREDCPKFSNPFGSNSPPMSQKPLLPKPVSTMPHHARAINKSLRLDCRTNIGQSRPIINKQRLREVYDAHRSSFWKMIAADYGEDIHPAVLEEAWREGASESQQHREEHFQQRRHSVEPTRRLCHSALPSLVHESRERGFSPINRASSAAPAPSGHARSYTLPTPTPTSSASSSISAGPGPMRATAIANLLTDDVEMARPLKRSASVFSADRDTTMRDICH